MENIESTAAIIAGVCTALGAAITKILELIRLAKKKEQLDKAGIKLPENFKL